MDPRRLPLRDGLRFCGLLLGLALHLGPVCCIEVNAPEEIEAVRGETVILSCSFTSTSRTTELLSVNWSFRPQRGGLAHNFFHFSAKAYPSSDEHFKGRVKWHGTPSLGDASIQLLNASLNDNGTYSCTVRNPPDVHGPSSQTILTVTPKKVGVRFSDVAVLLVFVIVPSGLIALVLLVRILCPCCSPVKRSSGLGHHSPIEVTDGEEHVYKQPKQKTPTCCELYLLDSDDEEYHHHHHEKQHMEAIAESQC
ncbi:myelin protein zero-like protein 3 [Pygocentrus nattereri]|uniref:Ig-like domain-containing protein n=1 Tax=Pygocentrus nattereri TaxID=42514 RepID=A0AAR2JJ17_PYGNA|nr:myelin protein zero-like protein 3 [Pygocentrus nattereri]